MLTGSVISVSLGPQGVRRCVSFAGAGAVEYVFDAVAVSGDFLLAAFQVIDVADPRREYLALDLNTAAIEYNYPLVSSSAIGLSVSNAQFQPAVRLPDSIAMVGMRRM